MSSRALRRHHRARMIHRAKYVQKKWWGGLDEILTPEKLELAARKLADNIKYCSCHMCCNARRLEGATQTRQEQRHSLRWELCCSE